MIALPTPPPVEPSVNVLKVKLLSLEVDLVLARAQTRQAEIERDDWRRIAEDALRKLEAKEEKCTA